MKFSLLLAVLAGAGILGADAPAWDAGNGFNGWGNPVRLTQSIEGGVMILKIEGPDSSIANHQVSIDPVKYNQLEIEYRSQGLPAQTTGQLFFANAEQKKFIGNQYWRFSSLSSDGKWQTLRLNSQNDVTGGIASWQKCGLIDKIRLDMVDQHPGTIEIRKIRFISTPQKAPPTSWAPVKSELPSHLAAKPAEMDVPYWSGYMLRSPDDTPDHLKQGRDCFAFRKIFESPADLQQAGIQMCADDEYELYINGQKVLENHRENGWKSPDWADATPFIKPGKNLIAGFYRNHGGPGGMLLELTLNRQDGTHTAVISDRSFRTAVKPAADDYLSLNFDDRDWREMIQQSPPPAAPWRVAVPYRDIAIRPQLIVKEIKIPAAAKAGSKLPLTITFQGAAPPAGTTFSAYLRSASGITAGSHVLHADLTQIKQLSDTTWQINWQIPLPRYFSSMPLVLSIQSKNLKIAPEIQRQINYQAQSAPERRPAFKVVKKDDFPELQIDGKPVYPMIGNCQSEKSTQRFKESNFHQVPMNFRTFWCRNTANIMWWTGPDKFDFAVIDNYVEKLLETDPDTPIIVWAGTEMPDWWGRLHPEELARFNDQTVWHYGVAPASYASERFLQDSIMAVRRLISHCRQAPYADKIAGFLLSNGYSCEWQNWGAHDAPKLNKLMDYSLPAQQKFKEFLAVQYPDIPEQKRKLPDFDARMARGESVFLPATGQLLNIAVNRFLSVSLADFMCSLAREAKKAAGPDMLLAVYYGYTFEYSNLAWNVNLSGHNALKKILDSPDIDLILSPPSYGVRNLGDCGEDMKPFASIKAAGKISVIDDDTRTHLIPYAGFSQTVTAKQTGQIMRRNLGRDLCRMEPLCLLPLTGGNEFSSPAIIRDLQTFKKVADFALSQPIRSQTEIAIVVSEKANSVLAFEKRYIQQEPRQLYAADGSVSNGRRSSQVLTGELIYHQRSRLAKLGAPVDYILAEDIGRVIDRPYKMWIFLNEFNPDDQFINAVKQLQQRKNLLVWLYAPGMFRNDKPASTALMSELTGMELQPMPTALEPVVNFPSGDSMGSNGKLTPLFAVKPSPQVQTLAVYRDAPDRIALGQTGTNIFCGIPHLSPQFLNRLAQQAGVHLYSSGEDVLYANSAFISFHAASPGLKTIKLPKASDVFEVFSGRLLAQQVKEFQFPAELHESFLFYVGDARIN